MYLYLSLSLYIYIYIVHGTYDNNMFGFRSLFLSEPPTGRLQAACCACTQQVRITIVCSVFKHFNILT